MDAAHTAPPNAADTARKITRQRQSRRSPPKAMSAMNTAGTSFIGAYVRKPMPGRTQATAQAPPSRAARASLQRRSTAPAARAEQSSRK